MMMKTVPTISPTLAALQGHLLGIQEMLYQREEAARRHDLEMREAELAAARYQQEMQQRKAEEAHVRKNFQLAMGGINQFKASYGAVVAHFAGVLQPLIGAGMSPEAVVDAAGKLTQLEACAGRIEEFLGEMADVGYEKSLIAKFLGISAISDFHLVAPKLDTFWMATPADGMRGWVALDGDGQWLPPWNLEDARAFQQQSNGVMVSFWTGGGQDENIVLSYDQALVLVEGMNAQKYCNRQNWTIPGMDALAFVDLDGLASSKVRVPRKFWIEYANSPGRLSAYVRKDGSRIMTGAKDKFSALFISN